METTKQKRRKFSPVMMVTTWEMDDVQAFVTRTNFRLAQMERRIELAEAKSERAMKIALQMMARVEEFQKRMDALESYYKRQLRNVKARLSRLVKKYTSPLQD